MNKFFPLPTLKARLAFWFTAICLVPLALVTTLIYTQRVSLARALILDKLSAVTSLRQDQINTALDNIIVDASTLASGSTVQAAAAELLRDPSAAGGRAARESLALLQGYKNSYVPVADVSIVSATGIILLCTDTERQGGSIARPALAKRAVVELAAVFGEAYISGTDGAPSIDIAAPVRYGGKETAAVLVVHYNLHKLLADTTDNRIGMGQTGEVVLVNREVMPLSDLRSLRNSILKVRLKGLPAQMAAAGQSGITQSTDYRGVEVLAAYSHIPRTGWGLVCKQDVKEVFAPITGMLYLTYGLSALISFLACGFALRMSRSISDPLVRLAEAATEIGTGDYEARILTEGTAEQVSLAASFNAMADTLELKMGAQHGLSRVSESLLAAETLDDFFPKLLPVLMDATGARMAVAFMAEDESDFFAPVCAVGADSTQMRRFSRSNLEGELGVILTSGAVSRLAPPRGGGALRFVTSFGVVVPAEIVTVPIDVDRRTRAFISLAGEAPFHPKVHEMMEMVRMPLGSALARVLSSEDVRRLAGELSAKNTELTLQSEELVQQSTELAQQSEELSRRNRILDVQKKQLEEATRLKSEFLSNMSHELRTPLNSVLALSRVLAVQGAPRLSDEERGYLSIIERNGKHLLSLINDILDLAKIESGRQEIFCEPVAPEKIAAEVIEGLSVLAEEKGISLTLSAGEGTGTVFTDAKKLRQMLQNLVGNAVKFTTHGSVSVRLRGEGDEFVVEVEDTGIGIEPQYIDTIFQEFRQADGSTSRSFEGTGLGLAIVKKMALLLGGDVAVSSEAGKGSLFTLRLPLDGRSARRDAEGTATPFTAAASGATPTPAAGAVLVVDDDPEAVSLIASYLAEAGYPTLSAMNGRDALSLARAKRPYAITLDVMMPEMDGWEVMRELKEHPETADIPVVIVSLSDDRQTGIALGAVGVITKPVGKEQLMETMAQLTGAGCRLVLVVDDDEFDRLFIASLFKEKGFDVLLAESGPAALELVQADRPDLITLDLLMPEMDGTAVLDMLRCREETASIPVVVITSKDLSGAELARLSSGVSAILSKGGLDRKTVLEELVRSLERLGLPVPQQVTGTRKGSRILIVEDSEAATVQLRFALESAGFRVDAVSGGRHALSYLKTHVPDGIILDLMMPEVDGFEVLKAVRSSSLTNKVPVMVMTAKTLSPGEHERLRALDVKHLVQKGDVEQQELLGHVYDMLGDFSLFRGGEPTPAAPRPAPAWEGDGSLLVVEDNPDNVVALKAVLGRKYRLVEATDGVAGLAAARAGKPSLILLDMQLPLMDGVTVLKKLKEDPMTAPIPVLALTASAMSGNREQLLKAGCAAYLSKPYQPEELERVVAGFVPAATAAGDGAEGEGAV